MQLRVIRSFADFSIQSGCNVGELLNVEDKKKARSLIASGFAVPVIDGPENATEFKNHKGK
jgi:hypothetical protein